MMPQSAKLTPNLDARSTKALNLTVLQRLDPFIEEILITAAHVTFYKFNVDSSNWVISATLISYVFCPSRNGVLILHSISFLSQSRKDVEGSLFVVKR